MLFGKLHIHVSISSAEKEMASQCRDRWKTSLEVPDDLRSCFAGVLIMKLIQLKDQRGLLPVPFPVSRDLVTRKNGFPFNRPIFPGKRQGPFRGCCQLSVVVRQCVSSDEHQQRCLNASLVIRTITDGGRCHDAKKSPARRLFQMNSVSVCRFSLPLSVSAS